MATVHDLRVAQSPNSDGVLNRLGHLLELELELGVADTRGVVLAAATAIAGAIVVGLILSRVSLLRVLETGGRGVRTGVAVASTVAAVDRFVADRRPAA